MVKRFIKSSKNPISKEDELVEGEWTGPMPSGRTLKAWAVRSVVAMMKDRRMERMKRDDDVMVGEVLDYWMLQCQDTKCEQERNSNERLNVFFSKYVRT